ARGPGSAKRVSSVVPLKNRSRLGLEDADKVDRRYVGLVLRTLRRCEFARRGPAGEAVDPRLGLRIQPQSCKCSGHLRSENATDRLENAVQRRSFQCLHAFSIQSRRVAWRIFKNRGVSRNG